VAEFSDVRDALASIIAGVVYPNGSGQASAIVVNSAPVPTRIYPGWPVSSKLDADMLAEFLVVSVFARPTGSSQNTTRFPTDEVVITGPVHTITATVDATGTEVTLGGTVSTPQNVGIEINRQAAFVHAVTALDTLDTIAAALATAISAYTPATAVGPVVTIPAATSLAARVGGVGTVGKPVGTQRRTFQITVWAPTPAVRDAAVKIINPLLRGMSRITFPDGTMGMLCYVDDVPDDMTQKENLWVHHLFYAVEYSTVILSQATEIIVVETTLTQFEQLKQILSSDDAIAALIVDGFGPANQLSTIDIGGYILYVDGGGSLVARAPDGTVVPLVTHS
jgi:hypothetical protein